MWYKSRAAEITPLADTSMKLEYILPAHLNVKYSLHPAHMTHLSNVWPMLDQRRRRWANIDQTLDRCVVVAGQLS